MTCASSMFVVLLSVSFILLFLVALCSFFFFFFFFSSRRRHTRSLCDWSSDVCSSDLNRDGHDHNISYNYGVEGPTDDPAVNTVRWRQMRNFLATLLLSQGVPMLVAGDETARTQVGNNNAWCQDNEISWLNWEFDENQR